MGCLAAVVSAAQEDELLVTATGAAVGFQTMQHKQTARGYVADSCHQESFFSHDAQDGLNHFLFALSARAALWRVSDLHVQDLVNTACGG